jgi:hypothetical protein
MNRNILPGLLLVAGILLITFGKQLQIFIPLNQSIFLIAGLVIFIIGCTRLNLKAVPRYMSSEEQLITQLKNRGDRIYVDFSKCEIKENSYSEEINESETLQGSAILGSLYPSQNVEHREVVQSVIVFESIYNGKTIKFLSPIIPKDKTTLLFLLYAQKETYIYLDPKDEDTYYFDLEFLS